MLKKERERFYYLIFFALFCLQFTLQQIATMDSIINSLVPVFSLQAYHNGEFNVITNKSLFGKWSILYFYPADFSPVTPSGLLELAQTQKEFQAIGCEVYTISTDSHFVHKAWHDLSAEIQNTTFPMLADPSGSLCRALGVMKEEEGVAAPSTFVANPEGKIKLVEIHDECISFSANELMRKVKAAIFLSNNPGEVCPAKWTEGEPTLKPSIDLVGKI